MKEYCPAKYPEEKGRWLIAARLFDEVVRRLWLWLWSDNQRPRTASLEAIASTFSQHRNYLLLAPPDANTGAPAKYNVPKNLNIL